MPETASARYDRDVRQGKESRQKLGRHAATWTAQSRQPNKAQHLKTLAASLALAGVLGGIVWYSTGHYLKTKAYAATAHHWAELETCLLGARRQAGIPPSERYRRIARDHHPSPHGWPQHCHGFAQRLDTTLQDPAIADEVGPFPHAAKTVAQLGAANAQPQRLDRLWNQLTALPLPTTPDATVATAAPRAQRPLLRLGQLSPLGQLRSFRQLSWTMDIQTGKQLRLFLPGKPARVCRSDGELSLRCRTLAISNKHHAEFRLVAAAPEAGDVVFRIDDRGRRGYLDGTTGQPLFRPPSDFSQALVPGDRSIRVLHAVLDGEDSESVDNWRVAELRRGKPLRNTRVRLPRNAIPILGEEHVLFWPNRVARRLPLFSAPWRRSKSGRLRLGEPERLGEITSGSKPIARCNSASGRAILLQGETPTAPAHLLLSNKNGWSRPIPMDNSVDILSLHCRRKDVALLRQVGERALAVASCTPRGCSEQGQASPPRDAGKQLAVGMGDTHLLFAWTDARGLVRLQSQRLEKGAARPNGQTNSLLMDTAGHGGIDVQDIQFLALPQRALLLVLGKNKQLYPVAVDQHGEVQAVSVHND